MGFEDEAEQSIGRPCRQTNGRSKRPNELTSSIVPRGTSFHRSVELELPPIAFNPHAAATSWVQRNSVPSTHMRCMITASRRARATIAFFMPRCLAIFIAQALSQDHLLVRVSMTWAASLIGRLGSSAFRLSTTTVSTSLAGSCFSSESAPRPFHHGIRGRGGTIYWAALPSDEWQVQATKRTHLIHRPARDIIPPFGGARASSYRIQPSCRCDVVGPAELGAVHPHAVHDHG